METCSLMVRVWDNALDERIIHEIEGNGGRTHFYHLWNVSRINKTTLNEHLKRLETQDIIQKDENPQMGKKRYIRLTDKAILKKSLDILEGLKSKEITKRHKKLIMLILGMTTNSYVGHIKSDGSINRGEYSRGLKSDLISKYPGISITDIQNRDIYNSIVNDFSVEEITESINRLNQAKVIGPVFTFADDAMRHMFDTEYEKLIPFINHCFHFLGIFVLNMKNKWLHLRKKPTSEEINWFVSIVGKNEMRLFFTGLEEERKLFPQRLKHNYELIYGSHKAVDFKQLLLEAKKSDIERIKRNDLWLKKRIEKLRKENHDLEIRYPVFYELIMEMIYPSFLH